MGLTVMSLFDGISCGQMALKRIGIDVDHYFASEIHQPSIAITQKNFPNTIQIGDVCDVDGHDFGVHYPQIDLLMGGSPCQGFSFAGKQLNFDDPRSILFFEFVRLLKETKPKYFLLENVKMKKEFQDAISSHLGTEPIEINSALVSGQRRKRLYWTNIKGIEQPRDKGINLTDVIENGFVDREKSFCIDANYFKGGNLKSYFEKHRRQLVFIGPNNEFRKLTPTECERLQTLPDGYTSGVSNTQRYKALGNAWTVDIIAHLFSFMPEKYDVGNNSNTSIIT